LHLGKNVNEFSMVDDQSYILMEIVRLAKETKPDAVLIAGDVYDKSIPSVDAVQLLDKFLVRLNELGVAVYLISGNHDSMERVAFAASLLQKSNVHISQGYSGKLTPLPFFDQFGQVNIWMLPYLKPSSVRPHFHQSEIATYSDALSAALGNIEIDASSRNILISHQFVTGAIQSESEELSIGGSENVDASLFDAFDYVALGHLHRPQHIGKETLRYCGTPLKYSLSEVKHDKSVTVVEMEGKGNVRISEIQLIPIREMREVRGTYTEITARKNYVNSNTDDYVYVVLTDEEDEPDAAVKLRNIYPNMIRLFYDNKRTQSGFFTASTPNLDKKSPVELLGEFYELQNGQPMSQTQEDYARELFTKIWEAKE